jgi:hypothetical protein
MSIYAITCNETGETYFGSTRNIKTRMVIHRSISNKTKSKQIIERNNYTVHILEEGFDDVEYHMLEVERWYIENYSCINKKIPGRTPKEYRVDNHEQIAAYYQNNKEQLKANNKAYKIAHKEHYKAYDKEYYDSNKEHIKAYLAANKEQIKAYKKEWYLRKKQAKLIKI